MPDSGMLCTDTCFVWVYGSILYTRTVGIRIHWVIAVDAIVPCMQFRSSMCRKIPRSPSLVFRHSHSLFRALASSHHMAYTLMRTLSFRVDPTIEFYMIILYLVK